MNSFGLWLGCAALFIIGFGFVWVIRGERYFGYLWHPYAMGAGILFILTSLFILDDWVSALLGVFGASLVWGSTELKPQAVRSELGWYSFRKKKFLPPFADVVKKWKAPSL